MDWAKGYSASYYMSILDKNTLRDIDRIEIVGGSISRSFSDLMESADVDCNNLSFSTEEYIRIWLNIRQNEDIAHIPLFTGIAMSPTRNINGRLETNSIQCYSLLKVAQDVMLDRGWYAPVDINGGQMIKELLSCIGAPIYISDDAPNLSQAIIAESRENKLSMAWKILSAMNWRMKLDGNGGIHIEPPATEYSIIFDSINNDVVEPSLTVSYDWYDCPNVFRAIMDNNSAVTRDDSPDSPFSTINRGREVWMEETSCYLNKDETLAEYANRRLNELQKIATSVSYSRRYHPDIRPSDIVRLNYPAQRIAGDFMVISQNVSLGYGGTTSEEVIQV